MILWRILRAIILIYIGLVFLIFMALILYGCTTTLVNFLTQGVLP